MVWFKWVCNNRFSMVIIVWSNNNPVNDMTAPMSGLINYLAKVAKTDSSQSLFGWWLSKWIFMSWKDYILRASFLLLFIHCFWWFRGIHRWQCGITLFYHDAPWSQKHRGEACNKEKISITPKNITHLTVGCPPRWCFLHTQPSVSLGWLVQPQFCWWWTLRKYSCHQQEKHILTACLCNQEGQVTVQ